MGPIGLPFQRTSTAPAFPTLSIATSSPVSVLVWLGCRIPEKIGLPSLVMESQVLSVAERFECFTPEGFPQRSWLRLRFRRVPEPRAVHSERRFANIGTVSGG